MTFIIELGREDDGRWLAEVEALPGVMCYGQDRDEAVAKVQALALHNVRPIGTRQPELGGPSQRARCLTPP
jgi:hypothetical protein